MRIIILGATGQLGKVLYEWLKIHHEVIGTTRIEMKGLFKFDPFSNDWSILGNAEVIINCIGQIYETGSNSFKKIHIDTTELIIKNREILGNPRIIQLSALGASEIHPVSFLRTKGIADAILSKQANTVVVRPSIVCTHRTMLVKKMRMLFEVSRYFFGNVFLPENFKKRKIQPVMPEDLAEVLKNLCEANSVPTMINVVGADRISFEELINTIYQSRNRKFRIIELPQWLFELLVRVIDMVNRKVISIQQYQLLFSDNVSDKKVAERYLGKPMSSTRKFWLEEFKENL